MGTWRNHVRAQLLRRDRAQKDPFAGVFTSLSQMEERAEIRQQILEDVQSSSSEEGQGKARGTLRSLQLQLRESEHLSDKLSQTVSDLTTVLYLKEAELQYWQSRMSRHRQEALALAKGSNTMKATLMQYEYTIDCQVKELAALRKEEKALREALDRAQSQKDELVQRWMEEKREEADRLNKYNDAQERWQRLAKHLRKHLHREMGKTCDARAWTGSTEASPSAINSASDTHQGQFCHSAAKV